MIAKGGELLNLHGMLNAIKGYQEGDNGNVVALHPSYAKRAPEDRFAIGRRLPAIFANMKSCQWGDSA
jgi:hypothetical protein